MCSSSLAFHWPELLLFWPFYLWVFFAEGSVVRRAVKAPRADRKRDRGTMWALLLANQSALGLAFVSSFAQVPAARIASPRLALWIGLGMMLTGSLIRRRCFRLLGESFSGAVKVGDAQPIVERGFYRRLRHPSYAGGLLMLAGVGVAMANWISLALLIIIPLPVILWRIRVEETALVATLGEPYRQYMKRTKRLIPFVY